MKVRIDRRGPAGHGAVRHAATVAGLVEGQGVVVTAGGTEGGADLTHAQFTDALWGRDIVTAAQAYATWADDVPRPLVVTLHDVPGGDPDAARDGRRRQGYRTVVAASDGVIVSSDHEAAKVRRLGVGGTVTVVELPLSPLEPVGRPVDADPVQVCEPTLAVLGFVYPGKGHAEVIDAAARRIPAPPVLALGAVSPGHDVHLQDLRRHAADRGVGFQVTGHLSDGALAAAMAAATVPVVPGRLVSASASLLTWIAQRRRPLCADGAYSAEIDGRHPGTVWRYLDERSLDDLVTRGLADPAVTSLLAPPAWPDVGASHVRLYADAIRSRGASVGP